MSNKISDKRELLKVGPLEATFNHKILYTKVFIELYENDFVWLTGPSGSGKTTLLRQIVGLSKSSESTIRIFLDKKYELEEIFSFRRHVLLILQNAPLIPGGLEKNLSFPFTLKVADSSYSRLNAKELLDFFELSHIDSNSSLQNLSVGEKQRISLIRAILWDPDIILADEPFSGLDEKNSKKAQHILYSFSQKKGKAVLFVSHTTLSFTPSKILRLDNNTLIENTP